MATKRKRGGHKPSLAAKLARTLRDRAAERVLFRGTPTPSHQMSKEERLKAGLRPRNPSKPDEWARLPTKVRERILANSKAHTEAQLAIGVPRDTIYGPYPVMGWGARWDDKLTSSHI